jgi:hypothetical protein
MVLMAHGNMRAAVGAAGRMNKRGCRPAHPQMTDAACSVFRRHKNIKLG